MSEVIAIVGRPNVGKSALFNRIARRRIAIVHDEPGVTRDRISVEAEWNGRPFTLVDTGGIGLFAGERSSDILVEATISQVELAIEAAAVIILVVNVQEGLAPLDSEVANRLRRAGKPVIVAVNKVDTYRTEDGVFAFAKLGFEKMLPVSAIHGEGIEVLMNTAFALLPPAVENESVAPQASLKLAIIGRPNVGKSSIINSLAKSERLIVSPIPGTTRDSIDVPLEIETDGVREHFLLIDTAGVRQERRIDNSIEFYSVNRTEDSIRRADIVILVLDAEAGILAQDKKVAGKIREANKACILVVNKWDTVGDSIKKARIEEIESRDKKEHGREKKLTTLIEFGEWVQEQVFFLDYAPVIFTSAVSGFHLDRLLDAVRYVAAQLRQKVPTALLNRTLNDAIEERQPPSASGNRLKFFYATQVNHAPPIFLLFVNRKDLFPDAYRKYLEHQLRKKFGFEGCPITLVAKPRTKTIEPKRGRRTTPQSSSKPTFVKRKAPRPYRGERK